MAINVAEGPPQKVSAHGSLAGKTNPACHHRFELNLLRIVENAQEIKSLDSWSETPNTIYPRPYTDRFVDWTLRTTRDYELSFRMMIGTE